MARGWSEMRGAFPSHVPSGQSLIVDAVQRGDFVEPDWCLIELRHPTDPNLVAFYEVMCDAFKIGKLGDSVRVNVTHGAAQAIADLLGKRLLTSKIVDARAEQAEVFVEPLFKKVSSTRAAMEDHSRALSRKIRGRAGLVASVGKHWINHPRLMRPGGELFGKDTAINYGWETRRKAGRRGKKPWPSASSPTLRVWQPAGGAHNAGIEDINRGHGDRSQGLVMGADDITVSDHGIAIPLPVDVVALDPRMSGLLSADGPVVMRHPWAPVCQSIDDGGSCAPNVPPVPELPPSEPGTLAKMGPLSRIAPAAGLGLLAYIAGRLWQS